MTESNVYLKKYEGKVQLHCDQNEEQQSRSEWYRGNAISEEAKTFTKVVFSPPQIVTEERAKTTTSNNNNNEYDVNLSLRDRVNLAVRKTMEENKDQQHQQQQQPVLGVVRWE